MNQGLLGYPAAAGATARIYNADSPTITNAGSYDLSEIFLCVPLVPGTVQIVDYSTGGGATPPDGGSYRWMLASADLTGRRAFPHNSSGDVVSVVGTTGVAAATFTRMAFWRLFIVTNSAGVATMNVWGAHTYNNNVDTGAQGQEAGYGARVRGRASYAAVGVTWVSNTAGADTLKVHPALSITMPATVMS